MQPIDDRRKRTFTLGRLTGTLAVLNTIPPEEMRKALSRHAQCDWGDCGPEDWEENELALRDGFRLFSVYRSEAGAKFWIITEADRSLTTVLLPGDY